MEEDGKSLDNASSVDPDTCHCGLPTHRRFRLDPTTHVEKSYTCCPKDNADDTRCSFYCWTPEHDQNPVGPMCLCNRHAKLHQIKKAGPRHGMWFYSCPLVQGHPERCEFWELKGGPAFEAMKMADRDHLCGCGKICGLGRKRREGPNCGREYYRCALGHCGYFSWA